MGHAAACAGARAVQRRLHDDRVLARVKPLGEALDRRLQSAFAKYPHVGDIRGRGLFRALELVEDRTSKKPFDPALRLHARVKAQALHAGLLCYPMGGTLDGRRGDHVLLAPPFILADGMMDEIAATTAAAVDAAVGAR